MNIIRTDKTIFVILGVLSVMADLAALIQFSSSGSFTQFWTPHWYTSIFLIVILLIASLGFFSSAEIGNTTNKAMILFGLMYILLALVLYIFLSLKQMQSELLKLDYLGFIALLMIITIISFICMIIAKGQKYYRYISYGFAISSLFYLLLMVVKYLFLHQVFVLSSFYLELTTLLIGSIIFITLFRMSQSTINKSNQHYVPQNNAHSEVKFEGIENFEQAHALWRIILGKTSGCLPLLIPVTVLIIVMPMVQAEKEEIEESQAKEERLIENNIKKGSNESENSSKPPIWASELCKFYRCGKFNPDS